MQRIAKAALWGPGVYTFSPFVSGVGSTWVKILITIVMYLIYLCFTSPVLKPEIRSQTLVLAILSLVLVFRLCSTSYSLGMVKGREREEVDFASGLMCIFLEIGVNLPEAGTGFRHWSLTPQSHNAQTLGELPASSPGRAAHLLAVL
jgi:hypothetical protein